MSEHIDDYDGLEGVSLQAKLAEEGLVWIGGETVDDAKVVLVSVYSHAKKQPKLGHAIETVLTSDDQSFVEGTDLEAAQTSLGLSTLKRVSSFENAALFALADVVTARLIAAAGTSSEDAEMETFRRIVIDDRNKILLLNLFSAILASHNRGKIYVFAGASHFNQDFLNLLYQCGISFAQVESEDAENDPSPEEAEAYGRQFLEHDQQALLAQWLAGRKSVLNQLTRADMLIAQLTRHPEDLDDLFSEEWDE